MLTVRATPVWRGCLSLAHQDHERCVWAGCSCARQLQGSSLALTALLLATADGSLDASYATLVCENVFCLLALLDNSALLRPRPINALGVVMHWKHLIKALRPAWIMNWPLRACYPAACKCPL